MKKTRLVIANTWDGESIGEEERVTIDLELSDTTMNVDIDAPFHNDPPPETPAGSLDGLWEFEVVELFLRGDADTYLELEFGPFGHYLALRFNAYRQVLESGGLALQYECGRRGDRWSGRARLPVRHLPVGLRSCNAYAMHGADKIRRYLALYPPGGSEPDFHRLEGFRPLSWTS